MFRWLLTAVNRIIRRPATAHQKAVPSGNEGSTLLGRLIEPKRSRKQRRARIRQRSRTLRKVSKPKTP
jgi:hypothetical protein